jgi:O-methyltransferase involved in polyketide biosynthesis
VRSLPINDAAMDGAVAWYSLMYLPPEQRQRAFSELGRVVRPGGYLVTAFKAGDNTSRRSGQTLVKGVTYDVYWHSPEEVQERVREAGFETTFWAGRPADPDELQPQGYLVARRT